MPDFQLTIKQGQIKGCIYTTRRGFKYNAYSGIPYAKPPIGESRFKDPLPVDEWNGIRDATMEGQVCAQIDRMFTQEYAGTEDCLYINVYVPASANEGYNLPVMVWIHGGGFALGSGNKSLYGPDYLIEKNVIVVTFNYRLGALGFLCLDTAEVPGNAGLKDQILALEWVQDNIGKFGGDRDNVTIFGESAGSASVQYLIISELGKNLFQRAIMQSGSCLSKWSHQNKPVELAYDLAKKLGFKSDDGAEVLKFLRAIPVKNIVTTIDENVELQNFVPVVEKEYPGVKTFIASTPAELIASGKCEKIPVIKGFTSQEGALFLSNTLFGDRDVTKINTIDDLAMDFEIYLPEKIQSLHPDERSAIVDKIKQYYFTNDTSIADGFINLMSDVMFTYDIHNSVKIMSQNNHPVYYYLFNYNGASNLYKTMVSYPYTGASHADELTYLFKLDMFDDDFDDNDAMMNKRMVELWTNFVKVGIPTLRLTDAVTIHWNPVNGERMNCLEIGSEMKIIENPFSERIKFLTELFNIGN